MRPNIMREHLSNQELEQYRRSALPPLELLAADDHLAECASCRARLAEAVPVVQAWQALQAALPASAEADAHLSYEVLAALVDAQLPEPERRAAAQHLAACALCAAEREDLQATRAALSAAASKELPVSETVPPVTEPASWLAQVQTLFAWRWPVLAGVSALILLVSWWLVSWWLLTPRRPQPMPPDIVSASPTPTAVPVEASPAPTSNISANVLALNDGGGQVRLDAQGSLSFPQPLPAAYEQMIKRALTAGRVETPALAGLNAKSGSLMGGNAGVAFTLFAPLAQVSESARPQFRWQALAGAEGYLVTVYDSAFNKVAVSPLLTSTEWQPAQPLPRGATYSWQVKARKDGQEVAAPVPPAPEAKFKVLERSKFEEVVQARRQFAGSHLALGLLYAQAGLLPEAERELQSLADANRNSALARKLLQSVKAAAP